MIYARYDFKFTLRARSTITAIRLIEFVIDFNDFPRHVLTPFMFRYQLWTYRTPDRSHTQTPWWLHCFDYVSIIVLINKFVFIGNIYMIIYIYIYIYFWKHSIQYWSLQYSKHKSSWASKQMEHLFIKCSISSWSPKELLVTEESSVSYMIYCKNDGKNRKKKKKKIFERKKKCDRNCCLWKDLVICLF